MRTGTTLILAAIGAIVLALGVIYGSGPRERMQQAAQGQLVFPGLAPKLAAAAQLEIQHKGTTLHLARNAEDAAALWGVVDRGGYRAQQDKVHELLTALTELRLDEKRTADAGEYARLGVADPADKGADSTLVRVLDGKGGVIAALIVGHARSAERGGADTLYVRRPGEAQSWLADGRIAATAGTQDWLDRSIVSIDAAKVADVVVTRGETTLRFARQGGKFTLTDPAGHPKLDDVKVDEVSRGLAELTLEDVKPAPAPGTPLGRAVFTTTDGMTLSADVSKSGPAVWATFAASGQDAADVAARVKGWAYEIGSWKEQALVPSLDDLKAAEPATSAPAMPAPATPAPAMPAPAPVLAPAPAK